MARVSNRAAVFTVVFFAVVLGLFLMAQGKNEPRQRISGDVVAQGYPPPPTETPVGWPSATPKETSGVMPPPAGQATIVATTSFYSDTIHTLQTAVAANDSAPFGVMRDAQADLAAEREFSTGRGDYGGPYSTVYVSMLEWIGDYGLRPTGDDFAQLIDDYYAAGYTGTLTLEGMFIHGCEDYEAITRCPALFVFKGEDDAEVAYPFTPIPPPTPQYRTGHELYGEDRIALDWTEAAAVTVPFGVMAIKVETVPPTPVSGRTHFDSDFYALIEFYVDQGWRYYAIR